MEGRKEKTRGEEEGRRERKAGEREKRDGRLMEGGKIGWEEEMKG